MARSTATAIKIAPTPKYEHMIGIDGKEIIVISERFANYGEDGILLTFCNYGYDVAIFKKWDYVIRGKEVTSSSAEP